MSELRRFRPRLARRLPAPAAPFCFERASLELFARRCQRNGLPARPTPAPAPAAARAQVASAP